MSKHNIECVMHALPLGLPPVNVAYSRNPEGLQLQLDYLLYKAEKLSLRPSVCPHFFGQVELSRRCSD